MKFSGFGQIKVRAECRIGGRIVSFASPMLGETMRKIAKDGMVPAEADAETGVGASPTMWKEPQLGLARCPGPRELGKTLDGPHIGACAMPCAKQAGNQGKGSRPCSAAPPRRMQAM